MTVDALINTVLDTIRVQFYANRIREYKRDERALMRSVVLYGHECNQRGWLFDASFLCSQLIGLLHRIRESRADVKYLPLYLDGAIRRSIGQRSEELSAEARKLTNVTARIVKTATKVEAVREPTSVEVCSQVFRALQRTRKRRAPAPAKQKDLL